MAHERVRFNLPPSPTGSPYGLSFEVEGRKRHKGKARSQDHRLISPTSQHPHLPTQLPKLDPSEQAPALISHFGHTSPRQRRISTPAPASGLQLHFENTNQPLDAFELAHTYIREYSQGVLDGQSMAGKAASTTSQQPRTITSHRHSDVSAPDADESIKVPSMRSTRSHQSREIQPVSGPPIVDRSSRPRHRREHTVSSITSSAEPSSIGQRTQNDSRSSSRTRLSQISHPSLAALLSNSAPHASAPSRRPVASLPFPTPPPNPSPNPPISSFPQPPQGLLQPEPLVQPRPARAESPATSQLSKSSWGTIISTSTNLTSYSLLGLLDFREGSYPHMVGSDMGTLSSPVHRLSSTVPAHETVGGSDAASPRPRGRNDNRTNPQRSSQYPPPPPSLNSWHGSVASLSPGQARDQFSSSNGYHHDDANERQNDLLDPNYSRDSTGSRPRAMESQRMMRGRNQPLPAVSPSFLLGDPIITEEDDRQNLMQTFGNALGLELTTGPTPISAPTPVVPHQSFLRSFSDET